MLPSAGHSCHYHNKILLNYWQILQGEAVWFTYLHLKPPNPKPPEELFFSLLLTFHCVMCCGDRSPQNATNANRMCISDLSHPQARICIKQGWSSWLIFEVKPQHARAPLSSLKPMCLWYPSYQFNQHLAHIHRNAFLLNCKRGHLWTISRQEICKRNICVFKFQSSRK